jgi:hypothetical protein
MRPGRAGRHHRVVRALEAEADGDVAGGEVDQPAGNKERADAARALFVEDDRRFIDAAQTADARADQRTGPFRLVAGLRFDTRVVDGLLGGGHGIDDEGINLALILHIHPVVGIELALRGVPEGHAMGDLAGDIINLEVVDAPGAALTGKDVRPSGFYATAQGADDTHSGDDDTAQFHR